MKNNFFYIFVLFLAFLNSNLLSEELEIKSSKIRYDNIDKITILEGSVNLKDKKGNTLFSEYAKYNVDAELAETTGATKIITSKGFEISSANVTFDNIKKLIRSNYKTQIVDKDGNKIFVDMFDYSTSTNIFFSKGNIKILDINNNEYNFSEIYIDENKKKIIGSDVKAFLKQTDFSENENQPRFFANTMVLSENTNTLEKGIFTSCKKRKGGKCPPWSLQSKKIKHDLKKKTIYYDNVVLKIYDFPIFFSPKFSHPDPTVKRKSGLLAPSFTNSNIIGSGIATPYFWNLADDKDLTLTPKLYYRENPLFLAEFRQDFKRSLLTLDAGYTKGYKKKSTTKTSGGRAHFFSNFNMNLLEGEKKNSNLEIKLQKASNSTYLKVYDINTALVNGDQNILENSIDLTYQDKDFYFSLTPSVYEDLNKDANDRHEYLLPVNIEKNIMSNEKYGLLDLETNLRVRAYETNKQNNMLVNDFNWASNKWFSKLGFENYFEGLIKNVNYDSTNENEYKNDKTNTELNSVLGFFANMGLYKNDVINKNFHTFTPKFLLRYAPGHMRNVDGGKLNYGNLFSLQKINEIDVLESGLSTSVGFEYKKNKLDKKNNISAEVFSLSAGQVISEKENMDIPSSTSLDQQFSDVVGVAKYNINEKINLNYNFSIDQSYKKFNYNEVGVNLIFDKVNFNIDYLQEKNHIGNQEFVESGIDYKFGSTELSYSSKRNLLTSSAEFYNLSYNYINDCLKAGIGYRREFYTDKDLDQTNRLMFTISIIPFTETRGPLSQ